MEECVFKKITRVGNWTLLRNSRKQCGTHASECAMQGMKKIRCYHSDHYCCQVLLEAALSQVWHRVGAGIQRKSQVKRCRCWMLELGEAWTKVVNPLIILIASAISDWPNIQVYTQDWSHCHGLSDSHLWPCPELFHICPPRILSSLYLKVAYIFKKKKVAYIEMTSNPI